MSDLPYFNFYPKDFASDGKVEAMTTEEIGAYILLLAKAWHEQPPCSVPDDDRILARWTRLGDDGWLRARSKVLACFDLRDGRLFQPRLELEYRKARTIVNKKSEGGKKGVEAREARRRTLQGIHDGHHQGIHRISKPDSEKQPQPDPVVVVRTAGDIHDEAVGRIDRTGMIQTLTEYGFAHGRAVQLAGNPWLTPERLDYILGLAATKSNGDRRGFIVAGIRDKYEPDPTAGKTPKAAEYKPPRLGALPC